jgi:hypothetical protein
VYSTCFVVYFVLVPRTPRDLDYGFKHCSPQ